ncbi:ABC transporter ATP-binding protein [Gordonibacter sp. 28C]|uniref:ABC transporter ATP-binding protein n=1 Tax=Gordonibacter sp. 28C TaxID=2078569 RepID=UPI001F547A4C|nr:ABC transporter ATP-binding protein [Gordonibacter sp. 28C]
MALEAMEKGGAAAAVDRGAVAGGAGASAAASAWRVHESGGSLLKVHDLHCGYGRKEIVHGVSFDVARGDFVCVIGANGCGKTTLLKNILGLIKPLSGEVTMEGKSVLHLTDRERAQMFAYIPQAHTPPFPFSVADVVLMGRTPYVGRMSRTTPEDRRIAWRAMCLLGIDHLAQRTYTKLSGGQQQLILVARALTQQPDLIIMDEPTASLDFGNQQIVLSRMKDLAKTGVSVLMVTHDPYHAFYCADRVIVMKDGLIGAEGAPRDVMTREQLEDIYHTQLNVIDVELSTGSRTTVCVPL